MHSPSARGRPRWCRAPFQKAILRDECDLQTSAYVCSRPHSMRLSRHPVAASTRPLPAAAIKLSSRSKWPNEWALSQSWLITGLCSLSTPPHLLLPPHPPSPSEKTYLTMGPSGPLQTGRIRASAASLQSVMPKASALIDPVPPQPCRPALPSPL